MSNILKRYWLALVCLIIHSVTCADIVTTRSGISFHGKVIKYSKDSIVFKTISGNRNIHKHEITSMQVAPFTFPPEAVQNPLQTGKDKKKYWVFTFDIDMNGQSGNTTNSVFGLGVRANREKENNSIKAYLAHRKNIHNENTIEEESRMGIKYTSHISETFSWFSSFDFETDKPEQLLMRLSLSNGLEYFLFKRERFSLIGETGLGYYLESYENRDALSTPALYLGFEHIQRFGKSVRMKNNIKYIPTLQPLTDYRFSYNTNLEFPMGDSKKWSLSLGYRSFYTSKPGGRREPLETNYYTRISRKWQ